MVEFAVDAAQFVTCSGEQLVALVEEEEGSEQQGGQDADGSEQDAEVPVVLAELVAVVVVDGGDDGRHLPRTCMSAELGGTHPGVFDVAVGAFEVAVFSDEFGKGPKRSLVGHGISAVVNSRHGKPAY